MNQIVIDPELQNLCPRLKEDERAQLLENLQRDGCRDPLALWGDVLLDGHNRYELCSTYNIPFNVVEVPGIYNKESAINWIIANQLGRRNVTPEERTYLIGKRYEQEKLTHAEAGARASPAGSSLGHDVQDSKSTAEVIAAEMHVSERTVRRAEPFARAVDIIQATVGETASREVRDGLSGLTREKVIEISNLPRQKQAKAYRQAKLEAAEPKKPTVQKLQEPKTNAQGYVMPKRKEKEPAPEGPPDMLKEIIRLNAAWPLSWVERYSMDLHAAVGDEADTRRSELKSHLGDLMYKLQCLAGAKKSSS